MPMPRIELPAPVRNKALAAGAAQWLEELPDLVASLETDWAIAVGRPYDDATEASSPKQGCSTARLPS